MVKKFSGLLWFLVFFMMLEVAIFRNPAVYRLVPESHTGQIFDLLQRFELVDHEKVEWLILGDSQSIDALRPPILAEEMGVKPEAIFNLSINSGKPGESLYLLEQTLHKLPNLKGVIVTVNEHMFRNDNPGEYPSFRFVAKIKHRLKAPRLSQKADLVLGWISYSYGMRDVWWEIGRLARMGELPTKAESFSLYPWGLTPSSDKELETKKTVAQAERMTELWIGNYITDGPHTIAFYEMIETLSTANLGLVLIQLPRTEVVEKVITNNFSTQQNRFLEIIGSVTKENNAEFIRLSVELPDKAFKDINHVNELGAKALAPEFAQLLTSMKIE